jgi:hypothetical protein
MVALAAAAVALSASTVYSLAAGSPITIAVQVGYHNSVKLGQWMPVTVDLANSGPDLDGTLEVQASNTSGGPPIGAVVYQAPVSLASGATKHLRTYLSQDLAGTVTARVVQNGHVVASQQVNPANSFSGIMAGILSDQQSALDGLGSLHPGGTAPVVVHLAAADVPDSVPVLHAFDFIAIDDFASDTLTAGQKAALGDYVLQGGGLLVGTGGSWHKTLAGLPAGLLPMQVTGSTVVPSVTALGGATGVEIATGTVSPTATVWLADGDRPLLIEATAGRGMVVLATFDWTQDAVTAWSGFSPTLRQALVRLTYGNAGNQSSNSAIGAKMGVGATTSIANKGGALAQALGNIPALELPAWWLIGALVFVYVMLVGPVNYFVLRAIGRRALAWVTVPAIAIVASAGAYGTSVVTKGTSVLANEVSVVHVEPASGRAYLEGYTGIIAPTRGDYQVGLGNPRTMVSPIYYYSGNMGDPNFGSVRVNTVNSDVTLPAMTAFTLRAFANEGMLANAPDVTGVARLAGGEVTGTVRNSSSLEFTDGVVISGSSYQKLGELKSGATATFSLVPSTPSFNGPPVTMTIYPSNYQFGGMQSGSNDLERQMETRSAILGTLMPNAFAGLPATTQPLVVLWTRQPFQTVTVNGAHPRTYLESAVVLDLPIQEVAAGAVPAGIVSGRMIDLDAQTVPGMPGMVIATSGSLTYSFEPSLGPGRHLTGVSITTNNPFGAKGFGGPTGTPGAVKGQVWDWSKSAWVDLNYQEASATSVPDAAVSPASGEVRLKLSSDGQFGAGWLSLVGTVT